MNNVLILLDNPDDWKPYCETKSILTVSDYLKNKPVEKDRKLVINLSNDYSYNSEGYYCSLLAQTRGQRVIPDVDIINKLETGTGIRMDRSLQALGYQWIQKNGIKSDIWYLNIYFGKCREKGLERVARFIFENYPCPLLRVALNTHPKNQIESIQFLPLNRLDDEEQDFFANTLDNFNKKIWRAPKSAKAPRYSLAVLIDPKEKFPPSNKGALHKLSEVAKKMNIHVEMITEDDAMRLLEFDALFIRTTTSLNHYTFHLSQLAAQNGMVVIDDPLSIIRCTNKVYLKELFEKERIPAPKSTLIFQSNENSFEQISEQVGAPFILKIPDGSYSIGMKKVSNEEELKTSLELLFEKSAILLAQAFTPTEFDWRVGLLNGVPLYACKYYMAKGHWQIYCHYDSGRSRCGLVDTIPIYQVPRVVLDTAIKAANLIGKGLYGVDLKMVDDKAYVIEINDNPSIDHELEDAIIGDEMYYRLLNHFEQALEMKHY